MKGTSESTPLRHALLVLLLVVIACQEPGKQTPAGGTQTSTSSSAVASKRPSTSAVAVEGAGEAAALPRSATAGDVIAPLPRVPRRLYDGSESAPLFPQVSCASLAPEGGYKLAERVEVMRHPGRKGDLEGTLEICRFTRWSQRKGEALVIRTGRIHHFVAAFPGTEVAAWTSTDGERSATVAPAAADAAGVHANIEARKAAGWSVLVATGLPDQPVVAVVSARFSDGVFGEELHYLRQARVLKKSRGRWVWAELGSRSFLALDYAALTRACERAEAEGEQACIGAEARIEALRKSARQRGAVRRQRRLQTLALANKLAKRKKTRKKRAQKPAKLEEYIGDGDPQSAWLVDGYRALIDGHWKTARKLALWVNMVCGESVRDAQQLLDAVAEVAGQKTEKVVPPLKLHTLCEPLFDKPPPRRTPGRPAKG